MIQFSFNRNIIVLLSFLWTVLPVGAVENIQCDHQQVLKNVAKNSFQVKDSEKYKLGWNTIYSEQEANIKKYTQDNKLTNDQGREKYFQTPIGKTTFDILSKGKEKFGYNAVAAYLFDDDSFNKDLEHYTNVITIDNKTYYLRKNSLIAVLEKRSDENFLLKRYNSNCQVKEVVRFETIDAKSDSPLSYKINSKFCANYNPSQKTLNSEQATKQAVYFREPTDDIKSWKSDIYKSCGMFSRSSGNSSIKSSSPTVDTNR